MLHFSFLLKFVLVVFISSINHTYCEGENLNSDIRFLQQSLGASIDNLGDKLKKELDDNFRKFNSHLETNRRQVSKTLTIFENEWKDKTTRLSALEARQDAVENSIMKLSKFVHQFENFENQFKRRLVESIQIPTTTTEASTTVDASRENVDLGEDMSIENYVPLQLSKEISSFETYSEVIFIQPTPTVPLIAEQFQNDATYYLSGTPESFRKLEPIPVSRQSELLSIELHYVTIDPDVLVQSLQNCSNLKSLKLVQVKLENDLFNNSFSNSGRILLPSLENFLLDLVGVLEFRNDTIFSKWAEIDEFLKGVDKSYLKRLIFFDKYTGQNQTWDVDRVTSLGTNIEIRIDGIRIFGLNYENGELSSMLKYTNDFLKYLDPSFLLKRVAYSAWRLDLALLPQSITHLNMNYVLDSNEYNFNKKLLELRSLQDLNIFIGNQRDYGWSLTAIPLLELKNLTIRYSDVRDFPTNKLLRLEHLYFHLCQIDLSFVQAFPRVFEAVHIGITFRRESSSIHAAFLRSVLTTPVQWIFMKNYDRKVSKVGSMDFSNRIEHFLLRAGVRQGVEHFILEKQNGTWKGRGLNETELALQTLELMGTQKFVTFETYQRIFH